MDNEIKISMIECLCKSISFLVRCTTDNETRKAPSTGSDDVGKDEHNDDYTARIINLSKVVMEFLETDNVSKLSPQKFDDIIIGCLVDVYRMPSVANDFETDTVAFYDWWRRLIQSWIRCPVWAGYHRLGCRHLAAMMQETTRDEVRIDLDKLLGIDSLVKLSSVYLESQQQQRQMRTDGDDQKARKRQATTKKYRKRLP